MGYIYLKHSFYTFFLEGSAKLIFAQSMQWLLVTYSDAMGIRNSREKSWFGGCGCLLSHGENTVFECLSIERMKNCWVVIYRLLYFVLGNICFTNQCNHTWWQELLKLDDIEFVPITIFSAFLGDKTTFTFAWILLQFRQCSLQNSMHSLRTSLKILDKKGRHISNS